MSSIKASNSKCSKPVGEFCRLHNPAPVKHNFGSVADVFKAVENSATLKKKTSEPVSVHETSTVNFQSFDEPRFLTVPLDLDEHVEQSKQELAHLSAEEKIALAGYTGFGAGVCNTVLLGKEYQYYEDAPLWKESTGPCDFVNREDLVDYMETMDKVLAPRQEEQRIVYRGIPIYTALHDEIGSSIGADLDVRDTDGLVEGLKEYFKEGKTFNYDTYLSTTHSADYAAERSVNTHGTKQTYWDKAEISGIVLEMKTNAGLDVTGATRRHHIYEREVILPRDTRFKVVGVSVRPDQYVAASNEKGSSDQNIAHKNLAIVVQMVEVDSEGNEITHTSPHKPVPTIQDIVSAN